MEQKGQKRTRSGRNRVHSFAGPAVPAPTTGSYRLRARLPCHSGRIPQTLKTKPPAALGCGRSGSPANWVRQRGRRDPLGGNWGERGSLGFGVNRGRFPSAPLRGFGRRDHSGVQWGEARSRNCPHRLDARRRRGRFFCFECDPHPSPPQLSGQLGSRTRHGYFTPQRRDDKEGRQTQSRTIQPLVHSRSVLFVGTNLAKRLDLTKSNRPKSAAVKLLLG